MTDVLTPPLETITVKGKPPGGTCVATKVLSWGTNLIQAGSAVPSGLLALAPAPLATLAGKPKLKPLAAAVLLGTVTVMAPGLDVVGA